jgi:hypothetical protein
MLTTNEVVAEAAALVREAESWATHSQQPPDPQALLRDQVRHLASYAPGAGCAAGLLNASSTPVVPLQLPHLTPAGDPLTGLDAVLDHWRRHPTTAPASPPAGSPTGRPSSRCSSTPTRPGASG